jgi:integrase
MRLTETRIAALRAPTRSGKQEIEWDDEIKGLGVLLSGVSTTKTFIVQRKLKNRTNRRVTIGPVTLGIEEARARAARIIADIHDGKDPKAERRAAAARGGTLRQALEKYIKENHNISPGTRDAYRGVIENHLSAWLDLPLRDIDATMVINRHNGIAEDAAGRGLVGHAIANHVMRIMRAIYYWAAETDTTLPPNPVKMKKQRWFIVKARTRTIKNDDLSAFHAAASGLGSRLYRDLILLLLYTGMRRGEAAALRWDEVDFSERVIKLPDTRIKTKRALNLPMSDLVRDLLVARRALGTRGPFVFPSSGASGHAGELKHAFDMIARECNVIVSAHDLRRVYSTIADDTVSLRAAMALVNHSVGGDVHGNYNQMTVKDLRAPAQSVADRLRELCKIDRPDVEQLHGVSNAAG